MAPSIAVGFLGLGHMGTAMARNLLKSKQFSAVIVWNRDGSKVRAGAWAGCTSHLMMMQKPLCNCKPAARKHAAAGRRRRLPRATSCQHSHRKLQRGVAWRGTTAAGNNASTMH